ncbi:hypothetical protein HMI66_003406 [Escherichia coli]|uniref:hypothetical protein n=1 Tax=Escherichia coli TaxID=562 RepID=UPI00145D8EA3|nr:hypothetical protein [Escherichia coli]EEQ3055857.1 hypothetical protein [Escherichia coli]EFI7416297.1 hypothetical protein [Escherichia coli]EFJ0165660.1 hypothetical protein [Escherichia coli]EFL9107858.1 hypothetical protein [Escherichia coli]EFO7602855.1 hypothetical protein [Escherichia coli]
MNKTKAPQGRFSLFSGLCLSLYPAGTQEGFPRRQHTPFEHVVEVPVGVDALIVCHRHFFASVKYTFYPQYFCHLRRFFIAILNGIRLDNAAILRTDDNVCASIAWFFIVKTIKEKKAANFG